MTKHIKLPNILFALVFLSTLLFFLPVGYSVQAEDAEEPPAMYNGFRFACMDQYFCSQSENKPTNGGKCSGEGKAVHRVHLESTRTFESSDPEIYVTECVDINIDSDVTEEYCTTGNATLDKELFCTDADPNCPAGDNLNFLKTGKYSNGRQYIKYNIENVGGDGTYGVHYQENGTYVEKTPPILLATDNNGSIINPNTGDPIVMEWQSYVERGDTIHRFLVWDRISAGDPALEGGIGGHQQDDLNFPFFSASCEGDSWDPFGYAFDARSLYPVDSTNVFLSQRNPSGVFDRAYASARNPHISNPYLSAATGYFSFFVEDGSYNLEVEHPQYRMLAPTEENLIANNYDEIYDEIYYSGQEIVQKNGIQERRDIPLYSENPLPPSPLQIMNQFTEPNRDGTLSYSGQVSHPFATLIVDVCENINEVENCNLYKTFSKNSGGPDKRGKFSVSLNQKDLTPGQYFRMSFESIDLVAQADTSFFSQAVRFLVRLFNPSEVMAQTRSALAVVDPIPSYIEGFAYDVNGQLMSNALVAIHVDFMDAPIFQKRANENGYFKITSEYVPQTPFTLHFTSDQENQKTILTTTQFLSQNKGFIESEEVNPFLFATAQSDPRRSVTPTYIPESQITVSSDVISQNQPTTSPTLPVTLDEGGESTIGRNTRLLIGAVALLIVGVVGGMLSIYVYRKKLSMEEQPPQQTQM